MSLTPAESQEFDVLLYSMILRVWPGICTTFYQSSRKWFTWLHLKILTAIVCCRTSMLGVTPMSLRLWASRHLLQLVSQPALSEVPVGLAAPAAFAAMLRGLFRSDWVVYAKRPFGGAEHAPRYLGCYTHRVAFSNHRLVALEHGEVVFRWRDWAHKNK